GLGLVAFALLTMAVQGQWLMPLNLAAMAVEQAHAGPFWDAVGVVTAALFSAELVSLGAAIIAVVLWRRGAGWWSLAPFGFLLLTLIEVGFKLTLLQSPIPPDLQR